MLTRAFDAACSVAWAMEPNALRNLLAIAARKHSPDVEGALRTLAARYQEIQGVSIEDGRPLRDRSRSWTRGKVAILAVEGPIFRYGSLFSSMSGATSVEGLARDLRAALDDRDIRSILLHVDSPGGEVNGTGEFADMIYRARGTKPIWAYVSHQGASAAYWIASAAERVVVAPTSLVGSIGVVLGVDKGASAEEVEFVSSQSPNKRPNPDTDAGRAQIQSIVDDLADEFVAAVARNRGTTADHVLGHYGSGGVFVGRKAVAAGLADAVGAFEATLAEIERAEPGAASAAVAQGETRMAASDGQYTITAGAIPPHNTGKIAPDDAPWDATAEVAKASGRAELRRMHAFYVDGDPPDEKGSYKLPHHRADGTLVPRGVHAAAARLNQTQGLGSAKGGVRAHLASHYHQMGEDPPWDKKDKEPDNDKDDSKGGKSAAHEHVVTTTSRKGKDMDLRDRVLAALFGADSAEHADDEADLAPAAQARPAPAPTAAVGETDAERELRRLREELIASQDAQRRMQAERTHERAEAFATAIIEVQKKAFPSERAGLIALYERAETDDLLLRDGADRVGALKAAIEARPKHLLDEEMIPAALKQVATLANVIETSPAPTKEGQRMESERKRHLLGMTELGRKALDATKNGN